MHSSEMRTLEAIFAHPLQHGIRIKDLVVLIKNLGGYLEVSGQRLKLELPGSGEKWIPIGGQAHHGELDQETVMKIRRALQDAGVTPETPNPPHKSLRGDQSLRLVLHLDHRCTNVYRLSGDSVEHSLLQPVGIWGEDQNLTHRHERDISGQRASTDYNYLHRLVEAMQAADAILLIGHGHGESDMRHHLLEYIKKHNVKLIDRIVDVTTEQGNNPTEKEIIALAKHHFGNVPNRNLPLLH